MPRLPKQPPLTEIELADLPRVTGFDRRTHLTAAEMAVLDKIVEAHNAFVALPRAHPMEVQEAVTFTHGLQALVMARAAIRAYPECFWSEEAFS